MSAISDHGGFLDFLSPGTKEAFAKWSAGVKWVDTMTDTDGSRVQILGKKNAPNKPTTTDHILDKMQQILGMLNMLQPGTTIGLAQLCNPSLRPALKAVVQISGLCRHVQLSTMQDFTRALTKVWLLICLSHSLSLAF